jgi:hypothetical protein
VFYRNHHACPGLRCINRLGVVTVQIIYRASLLAVWLGVLLVLSLSVQAAPSIPSTQQLAQFAQQERFQLPNPMSREYMQVRRSAPVRGEVPVEEQTPLQPRPAPYTN